MSLMVNDCVPLYKLSVRFFFFFMSHLKHELEVSIRIWGVWVRFRILSVSYSRNQ